MQFCHVCICFTHEPALFRVFTASLGVCCRIRWVALILLCASLLPLFTFCSLWRVTTILSNFRIPNLPIFLRHVFTALTGAVGQTEEVNFWCWKKWENEQQNNTSDFNADAGLEWEKIRMLKSEQDLKMEVIASSLYLTDKDRQGRHKERNHWRRACAEEQSLKQIAPKKKSFSRQHSMESSCQPELHWAVFVRQRLN